MTSTHKYSSSVLLADYVAGSAETDVLDMTDLRPIQHGLFGEVGGIMATVKKLVREKSAFPEFRRAAEEEFGDTLWYLAALCRRRGVSLEELFAKSITSERYASTLAASDLKSGAISTLAVLRSHEALDVTLVRLGQSAAALLDDSPSAEGLAAFAGYYLEALQAAGLPFADVVRGNLRKVRGAFLAPESKDLIDFDEQFGAEEQLPQNFRVRINQRSSGKSFLQWKGVFIGDALTDNIGDADGYRFHDVFHFANAAVLHWSPVIRALIKQKRKSRPEYDEQQDGGRAIVVEEGVTAWIFARAKALNYFEDQNKVSLSMLKTIQEFTTGFEVERCPLKLWEGAILQGYAVFRQVRDAKGGYVVGDRANRTLRFEPLEAGP